MIPSARRKERNMLFLLGPYVLTGLFVLFSLSGPEKLLGGIILAFLAFLLVSFLWQRAGFGGDPYLLPLAAALSFTGLIFLFRLNLFYCWRQLFWLGTSLAALLVTTFFFRDYRRLARYKYTYVAAGGVALAAPVFFGQDQGGARSWLNLGLFHVQPAEFVKVLLVLFLAAYLAERRLLLAHGTKRFLGVTIPDFRDWVPLAAMWGVSLLLLIFQKDLGTAVIYFATFLAVVYLATARLGYVLAGSGLFLAGAAAACRIFEHVNQRFAVWLDPWPVLETAGYQIVQSLFAVAAGGLTGAGLGAGSPWLIPAVHTDFIFAAVTEELGLLGGAGLILLYLLIVFRSFGVALQAESDFAFLLGAGLASMLGLEAFVIIAGVIKMLPLTGITLPFVSYGGSSLVAHYIMLGLLLNISDGTEAAGEK